MESLAAGCGGRAFALDAGGRRKGLRKHLVNGMRIVLALAGEICVWAKRRTAPVVIITRPASGWFCILASIHCSACYDA